MPAEADDTQLPFSLPNVCKKKVTTAFDGGPISSDGGIFLLAAADKRLDLIDTLAALIPDADGARRDPETTTVGQRRIFHNPATFAEDRRAGRGDRKPDQTGVRRELPGSGAVARVDHRDDPAANVTGDTNGPQRFSAQRKVAAGTRVLRGEPLETVARELNITVARLAAWRDRALAGTLSALKERERDERDEEIARLNAKVGEITMDNELLCGKIAVLEKKGPLAHGRSRR